MKQRQSENKSVPVKGLVIAGGFSRRMGCDKALICYHGAPQALWTYQLLQRICVDVWLGCRPEQDLGLANDLPRIHDREAGRGPIEGIAAALASDIHAAWLVVACDLPRLGEEALGDLLAQRDPTVLCTAYRSSHDGLPEPLCAIYEPKALSLIEDSIQEQRNCPRKVLIKAGDQVHLLAPRSDGALDNFNTPEEAAALHFDRPAHTL